MLLWLHACLQCCLVVLRLWSKLQAESLPAEHREDFAAVQLRVSLIDATCFSCSFDIYVSRHENAQQPEAL